MKINNLKPQPSHVLCINHFQPLEFWVNKSIPKTKDGREPFWDFLEDELGFENSRFLGSRGKRNFWDTPISVIFFWFSWLKRSGETVHNNRYIYHLSHTLQGFIHFSGGNRWNAAHHQQQLPPQSSHPPHVPGLINALYWEWSSYLWQGILSGYVTPHLVWWLDEFISDSQQKEFRASLLAHGSW